jgi:ABC-type multidrug transport system ATPase subunit
MSKKIILKTTHLTKQFSDFFPVKDLSIQVCQGEIYGFLGPNGAGKSTTMKMILGLMSASKGEIQVFEKDLLTNRQDILTNIGSLIEEPSYYPNLTGYENLRLVQRLLKLPIVNIDEALKTVRLTKHKDKLVKNYSLGMKQRLGIALALVKFPKLLILDEPTNGLDPAGIQEIRELIKSFPEKYGMTVFISSHLLSEIEQLATTVGIINQGKLLFEGKLSELEDAEKIKIETNDNVRAKAILSENRYQLENSKEIRLMNYNQDKVASAIRTLVENKIDIYQVVTIKRSLEEIFLEMTNNGEGVL